MVVMFVDKKSYQHRRYIGLHSTGCYRYPYCKVCGLWMAVAYPGFQHGGSGGGRGTVGAEEGGVWCATGEESGEPPPQKMF